MKVPQNNSQARRRPGFRKCKMRFVGRWTSDPEFLHFTCTVKAHKHPTNTDILVDAASWKLDMTDRNKDLPLGDGPDCYSVRSLRWLSV
jgi:hypothetical protein